MQLHLIEKAKRFTRDDNSSQNWESGFWTFTEPQARRIVSESADIFFHETQMDPSYFGGIVTGYETCEEVEWAGKIIFHFAADEQHKGIKTSKEGWSRWYKIVEDTPRGTYPIPVRSKGKSAEIDIDRGQERRSKRLGRPGTEFQREVFNDVYKHILGIALNWEVKYAGMERILFDSKWVDHWLPVGITREALKSLANEGFPDNSKSVVRGHIHGRKERAKIILDRKEPLTNAFELFMEMDRVVLVTKAENGSKRTPDTWSEVFAFPEDTFDYVEGFGIHYGKNREFLRKLAKENGIA